MSIDDASLVRVKAALGIDLPAEYERLVLAIPADLADAEECDISTDPDWLIQHNTDLRSDPAFFFGRERPWPQHLFVLGEDGNGNAFYLDLRETSRSAVYFLDHEQPDTDSLVAASSISLWLSQVREQLEEYRANAIALDAANRRQSQSKGPAPHIRPRPWWRFWG